MADIFAPQKQGLVFTGGTGGSLGILSVSGGLSASGKVLVTRVQVEQKVNNQFQPALDNTVYVYCFGDGIGQFTISGLTFSRSCNDGGGGNGVSDALSYYASNRALSDTTISLGLGGSAFSGYLHQVTAGIDNPYLKLGQFTLVAATLPSMFR